MIQARTEILAILTFAAGNVVKIGWLFLLDGTIRDFEEMDVDDDAGIYSSHICHASGQ
jgi:hypothetical protein